MTESNKPIGQQFSNVMPVWKFCFLMIITFGLYELPWCHKQWKFLKDRENLNINPWVRAVFFLFTMHNLAKKVFVLAEKQGYRERPSAFQVTLIYWIFFILSFLPDPFWLISFFGVVPLLTILKAVNYYWEQEQPNLPVRKSFTGREVAWIVFGAILWLLVIIGSLLEEGS
ncbi:MAG: hypothetical protein QQW96_16785 [Tychonema bourrellyi B0820]|uniref:DUF4234 domain-containing protein n=1 Tax=Tychonema bourrellyi FEM_GT703 TaxID=2040638 RepID=A0A2G4EWQ1_9CYAN|nr:hypothetical protein [Tychonema bourrellyi]MDQ2099287.1 hypothetical protein [Tychonema bourrellyi B0820]PHX53982.1 hypothetical protein CP500_018580 [Tychonema bourrellyi FEM_GT703]